MTKPARKLPTVAANAEAQNNLGAVYSADGRLDEAVVCFEAAIAARPDFVSAHYNLSSLKTYEPNDPHLTALESMSSNPPEADSETGIRYYFALGKAREDIGQYDRAFAAYVEGNRKQHALIPQNEAQADDRAERVMALFDTRFFDERRQAGADERTPIFILGMPRSGTTLIEQILASHPAVHGAGELGDLNEVIMGAPGAAPGSPFTDPLPALSMDDIEVLAREYLDRVWQHAPHHRYITDKSPANFFYIGMIYLMFPHSRIIHSMRDPMDSCFSCYAKLFNETMGFAYDLECIGRFYVRYIRLMRHWHEVLPAGTILDVCYEDVVADTGKEARRMLEYIGLPWDDACLEFYKSERKVKTASVAQVRQPIYTSSLARWKRFGETHLAPLLAMVEAYRDHSKPYGS